MQLVTFEDTLKHPVFAKECFIALDGLVYAAKVLNRNGADSHAVDLVIQALRILTDQVAETNKRIQNQSVVESTLKDLNIKTDKDNEALQ